MKVEVVVISKEIIRPSSPTPDHLRTYQLSFLDQISPPVYNPLVIFYSSSEPETKFDIVEISNQLKKSLSNALTQFYPLAGRAQGNLFIDCNDQGIPYLETRVKCQLSDVIQNPIPVELNKFIPFQLDEVVDISFGVQLNIFECGGIALGLCISHKIADALSFFNFIKTWAATARQQSDHLVCPQFVSAKLFPPKNISGYSPRVGITKENIVTRMFVFEASKIEALKSKYGAGDHSKSLENHQKPPSRVEALSAFIWSRFMAATQVKSDIAPKRIYAIVHAVNLRTRIDPPLPEHSFGNLYRIAMTIPSLDIGEECYGLLSQVRDQVKKIDKHYVEKLQKGSEHLDFIKQTSDNVFKGEMVTLNFTSLCRFPLYEADFGWGNPTWVGSPALTFNNLVVFIDAKSGGGIEAYINMKEEDLAKIEGDGEFLAFVSPNV
ncbi:unnamed protein product [Malus baccata var. baccata]|uniref:stemmadenine O-acetyltransferase-like n=1 Tax=Malus sylvestris TaxID=3752 RepID=UPI0021ACC0FC|nr:stemmadenine O-acetyltransferase-like [Malus sylvestris]